MIKAVNVSTGKEYEVVEFANGKWVMKSFENGKVIRRTDEQFNRLYDSFDTMPNIEDGPIDEQIAERDAQLQEIASHLLPTARQYNTIVKFVSEYRCSFDIVKAMQNPNPRGYFSATIEAMINANLRKREYWTKRDLVKQAFDKACGYNVLARIYGGK